MRWFKHLSMAHSDHAVSAVLEELGAEAYGVWWLIIEDIAASMEKNSKVTFAIHSDVKWSQICYCSARKFRSIANRLQEKSLIVCTSTDNRLQIDVPKLLKFRDEYSKKSGHSPDSRTDTDGETETDTDGEIKTLAESDKSLPASKPEEPPVTPPQESLSLVPVSSPEPFIGTIPLIDGSSFGFTQDDLSGWCEAYPAVDVKAQLLEMREWSKANPKQAKTKAGIRRYINTWLAKEQDKSGAKSYERKDAVLERSRQNLANIESAAQRLENSHGSSGGFLSQPDTSSRDPGRLHAGVVTDRGESWDLQVPERTVERSSSLGLLSIAEGYRGRM
jgi:hypothetical protein